MAGNATTISEIVNDQKVTSDELTNLFPNLSQNKLAEVLKRQLGIEARDKTELLDLFKQYAEQLRSQEPKGGDSSTQSRIEKKDNQITGIDASLLAKMKESIDAASKVTNFSSLAVNGLKAFTDGFQLGARRA